MFSLDEIAVRNQFIEDIEDTFIEYYDTIKEEVTVISNNNQNVSYPCCLVEIDNPVDNIRYDTSDGTNQLVDFTLNCELYSKDLTTYNKEDAVIKLSQILIDGLLTKYNTFVVTRNKKLPYVKKDIERRIVSFACTYDVKQNIIYS